MNPVTFHILDVYARDEKIVSANETEQLVEYSSGSEECEDDDEFQSRRRNTHPPMKAGQDHTPVHDRECRGDAESVQGDGIRDNRRRRVGEE
jgi:hypothetical protein